MFSFQWEDQFYIGGKFENVLVTLTYGHYTVNYSVVESPANSILNVIFSVQFKIIRYVFCVHRHQNVVVFILLLQLKLHTILPKLCFWRSKTNKWRRSTQTALILMSLCPEDVLNKFVLDANRRPH